MREGFYSIAFGMKGWGFGVAGFDTGEIVGADAAGATYDGTYTFNQKTEMIDAEVEVFGPPGAQMVTRQVAGAEGIRFKAKVSFPRDADGSIVTATTDFGPVNVAIKFLRSFP